MRKWLSGVKLQRLHVARLLTGVCSTVVLECELHEVAGWSMDKESVTFVAEKGGAKQQRVTLKTDVPTHIIHTFEFFMNQWLLQEGCSAVEGSTHGRPVCAVHTLH